MAAFIHEVNSLLGAAQTTENTLERILAEGGPVPTQRRRVRHLLGVATELKHGLERQATYLTDIVNPDARRRRSRQPFHQRLDSAVRLVQSHAQRLGITIENKIPSELKSPAVFAAELTAVFANLLTNAVKAAGENGRIQASSDRDEEETKIWIQNTGVAVRLDDSERWFKPFESTTSDIDPVLGQGMGLGLTISRNLLENCGAHIRFVPPKEPFSTAVEIVFPRRERRRVPGR
jgi:signal transduction histidine kinase